MPVPVYKADPESGAYEAVSQRFAWGPDLSSTLGGAGGIGGMAIAIDEEWDTANGSSAAGPMMATYDGNGNLTRLYDTSYGASGGSTDARARYEYGPFGESLSLFGGELALRNPIRWSTKWTDAETGLVYYGYRYYSASTGRWLGRDPMQEAADLALTRACYNDPIGAIDPDGRKPVTGLYVQFGLQVNVDLRTLGARFGALGWLLTTFVQPTFTGSITIAMNCPSGDWGVLATVGGGATAGVSFDPLFGAPPYATAMFQTTLGSITLGRQRLFGIGANYGVYVEGGLFWGLDKLTRLREAGSASAWYASIAAFGAEGSVSSNNWSPFDGDYIAGGVGRLWGLSGAGWTYERTWTWLLASGRMPPPLLQLCRACGRQTADLGITAPAPQDVFAVADIFAENAEAGDVLGRGVGLLMQTVTPTLLQRADRAISRWLEEGF